VQNSKEQEVEQEDKKEGGGGEGGENEIVQCNITVKDNEADTVGKDGR